MDTISPGSIVPLPSRISVSSHQIQRILHQHGIEVYHKASNKIQGILLSHKDENPKSKPDVCGFPVNAAKCTLEKLCRNLSPRLNEYRVSQSYVLSLFIVRATVIAPPLRLKNRVIQKL